MADPDSIAKGEGGRGVKGLGGREGGEGSGPFP